MFDNSENTKRIAKNTQLLYVRMLFLMLVSLYTSRVVLNALGVADYGIYNVVGGVVTMFSVLSSSFSSSISRYITFELGRNDYEKLKTVFSTSLIVQIVIALVIIIVAEVVGLWFLNNKMNIPHSRIGTANWVMHCSILSFAINIVCVPFNATIIAHERMGVFAYLSILEAILKLGVAWIVVVSPFDRLKTFAFLILLVTICVQFLYGTYCKRHFDEVKWKVIFDKDLLFNMVNFAGWNTLGNTAYMLNTQGINILINMFFGVTLNAARGVATQVENVVIQFVNSFMTAINPQITKSYAEEKWDYMHSLVCKGAKYSFFLMLFVAIPICLETKQILTLWLKIVPDFAVSFVRWTFVTSMCTMLGNTLFIAQLATGRVRNYQIVVSLWGFLVFPLSWLAFKSDMSPVWGYIIYAIIYFVLIFIKIGLVKKSIRMPWSKFIKEVLLRCFIVAIVAIIIPFVLYLIQDSCWLRLVEIVIVSVIINTITIYFLGTEKSEREMIMSIIRNKYGNYFKN